MTAPKKLFIKTYGCQMNVYDTVRMTDVLAPLGYETVNSPDVADMVILNTCHIREKASEKVFSELGQLRRLKEKRESAGERMLIGVAGCVASQEGDAIIKRAPFGYFATRWDDQPFVHPMTFWYDADKHCLYMHGAMIGRRDANTKRHEKIAFCASEMGRLLPSNRALNFSVQFKSVMAFGDVIEVTTEDEQKHAFYGLIKKY